MNLQYKKEQAIDCFQRTLNRSVAYQKAQFTEDEIVLIESDKEFQSRLDYFLILEKEKVTTKLRGLTESQNEKIKLSAVMELGRLIYPELFRAEIKKDKEIVDGSEAERFFSEFCK